VRLYALGLISSALGSFITPLWVIPSLGIAASSWAAGTINLLLAGGACLLSKPAGLLSATEPGMGYSRSNSAAWVAFVIGFSLFAVEIIGAKAIWLIVDSTAYAEGILFGAVLTSMAAGGLVQLWADRRRISACQVIALSLLLAALAQGLMIPTSAWLASTFHESCRRFAWITSSAVGFGIAEAMLVFVMLGPSMLGHGMAFSGLCKMATETGSGFTSTVGRLYGWNNAGAVLGAVVSATVLIPASGLTRSLATVTLVLLCACVVVAVGIVPRSRVRSGILYSCLLVGILVCHWGWAGDITFRYAAAGPGKSILLHHEDASGIVEVWEDRGNGSRVLKSSRLRQEGGTLPSHLRMQRMQGQLPQLLHPGPRQVLVVGLGTGISLSGLVSGNDVTCVEVSSGVIAAEEFFRPFNGNIIGRGAVRLVQQDGRDYIKLARNQYDLIVQDVFFPYQPGVSNLYSVEHFQRCRDRLTADGVMAQWLCVNQVSTQDLKTLVRTFCSVFPHTTLWRDEIYLLLWGTPREFRTNRETLIDRIASRVDPAAGPLPDASDLLTRFVCDERAATRWSSGAKMNTDDNAIIEFRTPLHIAQLNSPELALQNLRELRQMMQPVATVVTRLDAAAGDDVLDNIQQAAESYLDGSIALLEGDTIATRRRFTRAWRMNPSNLAARDWVVNDILFRCQAHWKTGNLVSATEVLDEAEDVVQDSAIEMARANLLVARGLNQDAEAAYHEILRKEPGMTRARVQLGILLFDAGRIEQAQETFRRGIELAPHDPDLQLGLERCRVVLRTH